MSDYNECGKHSVFNFSGLKRFSRTTKIIQPAYVVVYFLTKAT